MHATHSTAGCCMHRSFSTHNETMLNTTVLNTVMLRRVQGPVLFILCMHVLFILCMHRTVLDASLRNTHNASDTLT